MNPALYLAFLLPVVAVAEPTVIKTFMVPAMQEWKCYRIPTHPSDTVVCGPSGWAESFCGSRAKAAPELTPKRVSVSDMWKGVKCDDSPATCPIDPTTLKRKCRENSHCTWPTDLNQWIDKTKP